MLVRITSWSLEPGAGAKVGSVVEWIFLKTLLVEKCLESRYRFGFDIRGRFQSGRVTLSKRFQLLRITLST